MISIEIRIRIIFVESCTKVGLLSLKAVQKQDDFRDEIGYVGGSFLL